MTKPNPYQQLDLQLDYILKSRQFFEDHGLINLPASPIKLDEPMIEKIQYVFPIPKDQQILWADAEFDLRPSGIVLTSKGVYIRTDHGVFESRKKLDQKSIQKLSPEEQAIEKHNAQFHSGIPQLLFYSWSDFDPSWFTSISEYENKALLVDPKCSEAFINACRNGNKKFEQDRKRIFQFDQMQEKNTVDWGITGAAGVQSAESAVFTADYSRANGDMAGHGLFAEKANNINDHLHGRDARVVGGDNIKNGPDRLVDGIFIQTKYYRTASRTLNSAFDQTTQNYKYMTEGKPMQLEVPKDQYADVLRGFAQKIRDGKVPGVTNPADAEKYVRKGTITYDQAVNLTKAGNIDSLKYDIQTGAVICTSAFGISFLSSAFLAYQSSKDMNQAIAAGFTAGIKVFGTSMIQHIAVQQLSRTALQSSLIAPSQWVVGKIGYSASAAIVNGIRALAGKEAIYGAAAAKQLAKIFRGNLIAVSVSFLICAVPDTFNLCTSKISSAQYTKNMITSTAGIAGGVGGYLAAGTAAAKIGAATGTSIAPGLGTVIGAVGGMVGGVAASMAAKTATDIFAENDSARYSRMFNAIISAMCNEYLLDEDEMDDLVEEINKIPEKDFNILFQNLNKEYEQEKLIREKLSPIFDKIVFTRKRFKDLTDEQILKSLEYCSSLIPA